jgi:hypothetical protein
MDKTEAVELIENEFPKLGLQHYRNLYDPTQKISDILAAISRAKDEVVDAEEYAPLAKAMEARSSKPIRKRFGLRSFCAMRRQTATLRCPSIQGHDNESAWRKHVK